MNALTGKPFLKVIKEAQEGVAFRAGLPKIDWGGGPTLLAAYETECGELKTQEAAAIAGTLSRDQLLGMRDQQMELENARLDPDVKVTSLPNHRRLSDLLDQAIVEVVRTDKTLLRGIYREMLDNIGIPVAWLIKPIAKTAMGLCFFKGPARLIETLVRTESYHSIEHRAELCKRILARMLASSAVAVPATSSDTTSFSP